MTVACTRAALGYQGSYNRVAAFARAWHARRHEVQRTTGRGTFVPLAFGPGEIVSLAVRPDHAQTITAFSQASLFRNRPHSDQVTWFFAR